MTISPIELPQFIHGANFLFRDEAAPKFWLAGGSILSLCKGTPVSDYDLFAPDPTLVCEMLNGWGAKETFSNDWVSNYCFEKKKIQVIKKYVYATMKDTIDSFDFTCISAAYNGKELVSHDRFYLDAAQSRLVLNKLSLPLSTIKRALKYSGR